MTAESLDILISCAETSGILIDKRAEMPKGSGVWKKRKVEDIVGLCLHQNGSSNISDPKRTAKYHTSPNHISSKGLPGICYDFAIPDLDRVEPAWLVSDLLDIKYAQGSGKHPGNENKHLISILIMGDYSAPGHRGSLDQPSVDQLNSLNNLVQWLAFVFKIEPEGLFGHFDFGKVACPGSWGMAWLDAMRPGRPFMKDKEWQEALLLWDPDCLPKYGADGHWGSESRYALSRFQKDMSVRPTAFKDIFTELFLLRFLEGRKDDG